MSEIKKSILLKLDKKMIWNSISTSYSKTKKLKLKNKIFSEELRTFFDIIVKKSNKFFKKSLYEKVFFSKKPMSTEPGNYIFN